MNRTKKFLSNFLAGFCLLIAATVAYGSDWPQHGRTNQRNMVSDDTGLPDSFEPGSADTPGELVYTITSPVFSKVEIKPETASRAQSAKSNFLSIGISCRTGSVPYDLKDYKVDEVAHDDWSIEFKFSHVRSNGGEIEARNTACVRKVESAVFNTDHDHNFFC